MRAAIASVASAALLLAASGCGGGGSSSGASTPTTTPSSPAAQRAEIKRVWEQFFSGTSSGPQKVALLQNGDAFRKVIDAQVRSPLAKQSSATVTRVTLSGPARASVLYTIELSHNPVLKNQRGTAVKVDGAWKVGQGSFCRLLALQGSVPNPCQDVG
jgi:hypothetical protein